jgi:hypothetical protein
VLAGAFDHAGRDGQPGGQIRVVAEERPGGGEGSSNRYPRVSGRRSSARGAWRCDESTR